MSVPVLFVIDEDETGCARSKASSATATRAASCSARPAPTRRPGAASRAEPRRRRLSVTGADLAAVGGWPLEREPVALKTSVPGVFAAGDLRHGSMNRSASAVGGGSIAVRLVHDLLAAERLPPRQPA